jgi:calcium-binding protein CML
MLFSVWDILSVSPTVLDLLVSKFDKTWGKSRAIEYDNFIE